MQSVFKVCIFYGVQYARVLVRANSMGEACRFMLKQQAEYGAKEVTPVCECDPFQRFDFQA